MSFYMQRNY